MDIEKIIKNTTEQTQENVNWTKVWSSRYPVLATYQEQVNIAEYAKEIRRLLEALKRNYGYNELDAVLVLKDILVHEMKR